MPNQHSKTHTPRSKPVPLRLRPEEKEEAIAAATEGGLTVSDVIRERCGWVREDGQPNRPWSNRRKAGK